MIGRTRKLVGWRSCAGGTRIPGLFETLSAPTKNVVNGVTSYTWFDIDEFCVQRAGGGADTCTCRRRK